MIGYSKKELPTNMYMCGSTCSVTASIIESGLGYLSSNSEQGSLHFT